MAFLLSHMGKTRCIIGLNATKTYVIDHVCTDSFEIPLAYSDLSLELCGTGQYHWRLAPFLEIQA
ncbi:hypothetical protein DOK_07779 [gamma proteobacterium BDW918]|nr:hypothetical protein DOK_07779 [gamma proteobacterium BDW918]